jgi:hypothetical protein
MLLIRGKMPLPHIFIELKKSTVVFGKIVGVASSHDVYAPKSKQSDAKHRPERSRGIISPRITDLKSFHLTGREIITIMLNK